MKPSREAGNRRPGAAGDDAVHRHRALLGRVVLEREPKLVDQPRRALRERIAGGGHRLLVTLDLVQRPLQSDVDEPLARVLQGEFAALGKSLRDSLDPKWRDPREQAGLAAGYREVGDVAEVAVEPRRALRRYRRSRLGCLRLRKAGGGQIRGFRQPGSATFLSFDGLVGLAGEGANHPECREVDPDRTQPRGVECLHQPAEHVAAGGHRHHVDVSLSALPVRVPDHLPVQHSVLEGHRDVILGLEPDRGLELGLVVDSRQSQAPDGDPLAGDPHPDRLRELALREQLLERLAEGIRVGDLPLPEDPGAERDDAELADRRVAVGRGLRGRDAAGLDVEADYRLGRFRREHQWLDGGVLPLQGLNRPGEAIA